MPSEPIEHPSGASSAVPEKLRFDINLGLLSLGLVVFPILLALGFWQLNRADEKTLLLESHQSRQSLDPLSLNLMSSENLLALPPFTKVKLVGTIEEGVYWLLDNRIHRGRVGYEVLQVARVNTRWVLINRGWIEGSFDRTIVPEVQMLKGSVSLTGQISIPSKNIMMGNLPPDALMAQRIVEIDLAALSANTGMTLSSLILLSAESEGALVTDWPTVNISPTKHQAYAVQWFSMAFALLVLLIFANTNLQTVLRQKSANNKK